MNFSRFLEIVTANVQWTICRIWSIWNVASKNRYVSMQLRRTLCVKPPKMSNSTATKCQLVPTSAFKSFPFSVIRNTFPIRSLTIRSASGPKIASEDIRSLSFHSVLDPEIASVSKMRRFINQFINKCCWLWNQDKDSPVLRRWLLFPHFCENLTSPTAAIGNRWKLKLIWFWNSSAECPSLFHPDIDSYEYIKYYKYYNIPSICLLHWNIKFLYGPIDYKISNCSILDKQFAGNVM